MGPDEPPPLPAYMEIANLEHEIAMLREKLGNIEKWAKRVVWPSLIVMFVVVLAVGIYGFLTEDFLAVGIALVCFLFLSFVGVAAHTERLIDFVSTFRPGMGTGSPKRSYAIFLEKRIAKREKRLAELKAQS